MSSRYPCQTGPGGARSAPAAAAPAAPASAAAESAAAAPAECTPAGPALVARRVDEVESLDELFRYCLPAFGAAFLSRVYGILDRAIGAGCPLTLAIAGPVTVSAQHHTWLIPLLETGWVAYLSTTDAVCYHDGHRSLHEVPPESFFQVPLHGDDGALRDERTIRVANVGFDEAVLLNQDRFISAALQRPDFQKKMTGTEFRYRLGELYHAQEQVRGLSSGLLACCQQRAIPILVGAPADGSVFLNSVKLWAMQRAGMIPNHQFELDMHAEVFESCAYHLWGLRESPTRALATLILGGGVPKNYNLQPEPTLSQILGLENISGYAFDVQIVSAPVSDGSLSSCLPAEAVTWGKVDRDLYQAQTESVQADYSLLMPFIVRALLEKRQRYARWAERMGEEALFAKHPEARGYLRPMAGYRLYEQRESLTAKLLAELQHNGDWLRNSLHYPLPDLQS
ncbi:MAG: deoxyhypusine synthase family protein [Planctomycetota bacterium]